MTDTEIDMAIDDLRRAMAAGVKVVWSRTNGVEKRIEYQSIDAMRKAMDDLQALKSGARVTRTVAGYSNGLWP